MFIILNPLIYLQMSIEHAKIFDMIYGFDAVNGTLCKECVATKLWNNPLSMNCKVLITNSNPTEVDECGFKDITLISSVPIKFARMGKGKSEQRTAYIYKRASLPKSRARIKFEYENPVLVAPYPFKEVWADFNKGRLDQQTGKIAAGYKYNVPIMKRNLEYSPNDECLSRDERKNRTQVESYDYKKLEKLVWGRT